MSLISQQSYANGRRDGRDETRAKMLEVVEDVRREFPYTDERVFDSLRRRIEEE